MLKRTLLIVISASLLIAAVASADDIVEAAKKGDLETVRAILEIDPSMIRAVDGGRWTALHWAAIRGHWDVYEFLFEYDPGIDPVGADGCTPLNYAAHNDRPDMIRLLLDRGADPNIRNIWGMTPLHTAVWRNCPGVVTLLLDSGADPEIKTNEGWTPLHYANLCGRRELVDMLLKRGLSADAEDSEGRKPSELWRERPQPVEIDPSLLEAYVGRYAVSENFAFDVWLDDGKLYLMDFTHELMYPVGPDEFFCEQAPWRARFLRDDAGEVDKIEVHFIRQAVSGTKVR